MFKVFYEDLTINNTLIMYFPSEKINLMAILFFIVINLCSEMSVYLDFELISIQCLEITLCLSLNASDTLIAHCTTNYIDKRLYF